MDLLDAVIGETRRRREGDFRDWAVLVTPDRAEAERSRLAALAERSGAKGALAGLLDDLLRHA